APASVPVDCAALLPREAVQSSIGDDVEPWTDRGPVLSQTLRQAALDRAGAVHCAWRNGFGSASARTVDLVVLPGSDLVWDAHFAAPVPEWVERESFDELGVAGFSAVHTSTFTGAIDGVVSTLSPGGAWVDVWSYDEARDDDLDIAVSLAGTALQTLGPGRHVASATSRPRRVRANRPASATLRTPSASRSRCSKASIALTT